MPHEHGRRPRVEEDVTRAKLVQLLAGYVELADCEFDASQTWYDKLVAKLQPIVIEID